MRSRLGCLLLFGLLAPLPAGADESASGEAGVPLTPSEDEAAEEFHRNHVAVLVGGTLEFEEHETLGGVTVGLDYEYRVNEIIGIGAVAEYAGQDLDATTLLGVVDIHLWRGLAAQTGPGVEFIDDEDLFVYRVGLLYEFEIGEYTLSPQVHMDMTDEERATIFVLAAGFPF